jgi:hypothetical protein
VAVFAEESIGLSYALNQWEPPSRFWDDGEPEIDNAATEPANRISRSAHRNRSFSGDRGLQGSGDVANPVTRINELMPHN